MKNNRIGILDSFRGIAILMVIFFHFFSRWTNLYPYESKYDYFGYGKFGVHFLFMISGFVILFTLERTKSLTQFWFNRFARLFPAMFFASVLTYIFFNLFDTDFLFPTSHYFKNVLVSLTFIQPDLLSSLTRYTIELDYISGCYWSLWVEIQFYVLASFLYFFGKRNFYRNFFVLSIILIGFNFLLYHIYVVNGFMSKLRAMRSIFNLLEALPFFCLGALFYVFYGNNLKQRGNSILEKSLFCFFTFFLLYKSFPDFAKMWLFVVFISLFLLMIYYPKRISFLNTKVLNRIGVSSYFLYLIHENIGVFLIHENYLNFKILPFLPAVIYVLILIVCSFLFTQYVEERIIKSLKKNHKF